MRSKKKGLRCVKGVIAFLSSLKGRFEKSLGNIALDSSYASFRLISLTNKEVNEMKTELILSF